jgi:hypothetical protein
MLQAVRTSAPDRHGIADKFSKSDEAYKRGEGYPLRFPEISESKRGHRMVSDVHAPAWSAAIQSLDEPHKNRKPAKRFVRRAGLGFVSSLLRESIESEMVG